MCHNKDGAVVEEVDNIDKKEELGVMVVEEVVMVVVEEEEVLALVAVVVAVSLVEALLQEESFVLEASPVCKRCLF